MAKLDDRIPIPPKDTININLSSATEQTMKKKFGIPGAPDPKCGEPSAKLKKRIITDTLFGKFRVQGLDFGVESLRQIFAEVAVQFPEVHAAVKNDGMLCVRNRRNNPSKFSNHSWGTAIDIFFGKDVVPQGTHLTHRGNFLLFPFFNRHKWYWGAEFSGDAVDSMHFELSEEVIATIPFP
jgi:hypothetical protein